MRAKSSQGLQNNSKIGRKDKKTPLHAQANKKLLKSFGDKDIN
jgi:hypothetical protein